MIPTIAQIIQNLMDGEISQDAAVRQLEELQDRTVYLEELRDHFAGQALAGMCALPINVDGQNFEAAVEHGIRTHAECAYRFADAMLKERQS